MPTWGWGYIQTNPDIFETAYFYPDYYEQGLKLLLRAVSNQCSCSEQIHSFCVDERPICVKKCAVLKISGFVWKQLKSDKIQWFVWNIYGNMAALQASTSFLCVVYGKGLSTSKIKKYNNNNTTNNNSIVIVIIVINFSILKTKDWKMGIKTNLQQNNIMNLTCTAMYKPGILNDSNIISENKWNMISITVALLNTDIPVK